MSDAIERSGPLSSTVRDRDGVASRANYRQGKVLRSWRAHRLLRNANTAVVDNGLCEKGDGGKRVGIERHSSETRNNRTHLRRQRCVDHEASAKALRHTEAALLEVEGRHMQDPTSERRFLLVEVRLDETGGTANTLVLRPDLQEDRQWCSAVRTVEDVRASDGLESRRTGSSQLLRKLRTSWSPAHCTRSRWFR